MNLSYHVQLSMTNYFYFLIEVYALTYSNNISTIPI